ncbi:MAG: response regulator transcription factor, partial [Bacteroidetes bacterium]|nr:response regulator transcription factor [Bacteroidota bacterium]
MIKSIIIDDEDKARKNLESLLVEFCNDVEVVAMEGTVDEGITAIKKSKPDVVLDIKMRNETGFDLLEKMDNIDFDIIFVTAHDEYAIQAFKFSAIDYIMKPINIEDLQNAIEKVATKQKEDRPKMNYEILKENISRSNVGQKKIAIPTSEGLLFIQVKDIIRCEADGSYTHIFLANKDKITVSKILKEFEGLLTEYNFLRVHQSHLINLEHIKKYVSAKGGQIVMK